MSKDIDQTRTFFPRRLSIALNERGWSGEELARRTHLRRSAVSHFRRGRRMPSAHNLSVLSKALGVSSDWLLGISEDKSSENCRTCQRLAAEIRMGTDLVEKAAVFMRSRLLPGSGQVIEEGQVEDALLKAALAPTPEKFNEAMTDAERLSKKCEESRLEQSINNHPKHYRGLIRWLRSEGFDVWKLADILGQGSTVAHNIWDRYGGNEGVVKPDHRCQNQRQECKAVIGQYDHYCRACGKKTDIDWD